MIHLRALAFLLLAPVAAAPTWVGTAAAGVFASDPNSETSLFGDACAFRLEGFRKTVSWYSGRNRLLVEADLACGLRYGSDYDLTNVTVTVLKDGKVFARLHSSKGAYSGRSDELLVQSEKVVMINLTTGEYRTPGYRTLLNKRAQQ